MKRINKLLSALTRTDGRLLATLSGLALVAVVNLAIAYRRGSLADAIAVAAIFLIIVPWLALRGFLATRRPSGPQI